MHESDDTTREPWATPLPGSGEFKSNVQFASSTEAKDDGPSPLQIQMRWTDEKLRFLAQQVDSLDDRLAPLQTPHPRKTDDGEEVEIDGGHSELVAVLQGFNNRLDALQYRVGLIHENLEL